MARVVVIIEDDDGNRDVWDVFDPDRVRWDWIGTGIDGARARITVEGAFHRRHQTPEGFALSQRMKNAIAEQHRNRLENE